MSSPLQGRVIFLVGMMRSGTNWLQRMLQAHEAIEGMPQETDLLVWVQEFRDRFQHANSSSLQVARPYISPGDFRTRMREFCDDVLAGYLPDGSDGKLLLERTPQHVGHLDLVAELYPDAQVVHIIRDGRDVARSLVNMDFGPSTIRDAAEAWKSSILKARHDATGLDHYQEVRYEVLLEEPEQTIKTIWEGLGLAYSEADVARAVEVGGVHYNVDRGFPEVASGKWQKTFTVEDIAAFDEVAGDLLAELGYADSGAPVAAAPGSRAPRVSSASARRPWLRLPGRRGSAPKDAIKVPLSQTPQVIDSFIAALMSAKADTIEEMLTVDCRVRLVAGGSDWTGRGQEARDRLVELMRVDGALRGRQVRVDVHPSRTTWVILGAYATDDGDPEERLMIVRLAGSAVEGLDYYQLPLVRP